jgi:hypothetical protein
MTVLQRDEVTILSRLIRPDRNGLPATAARAFLRIDFDDSDRKRMHELSAKARDGTLTEAEESEIASYEIVAHVIDMLHSKARRSLKRIGARN